MGSEMCIRDRVEAIEEGLVTENSHVLMPAFGGGLTWSAHLLRFVDKPVAKGQSNCQLPPCELTGLALVKDIMKQRS